MKKSAIKAALAVALITAGVNALAQGNNGSEPDQFLRDALALSSNREVSNRVDEADRADKRTEDDDNRMKAGNKVEEPIRQDKRLEDDDKSMKTNNKVDQQDRDERRMEDDDKSMKNRRVMEQDDPQNNLKLNNASPHQGQGSVGSLC